MRPAYKAEVRDGEIVFLSRQDYEEVAKRYEGKKIRVAITVDRPKRSENQNRYYWGVVIPFLAEAFGWDDHEELHEGLKWKFLRRRKGPFTTVPTSTDLNTVEWEEFMTQIRTYAATEFGINIPLPNEAVTE